jgi:hypothetical protein
MAQPRIIDATPLEQLFQNLAKSWSGTWSGPAYLHALEHIKNAPTVAAVPAEKYNALKERYDKLLETADILDAALREYQQKYGE